VTGTIDGAEVTDTGAFAINSVVVGSCSGITGSGTFVLQIETTEGVKTVAGRFDIFSGALPGEVDLTGDLVGTVSLVSADGDCINTPISVATDRLDVHIGT